METDSSQKKDPHKNIQYLKSKILSNDNLRDSVNFNLNLVFSKILYVV